MTVAKVTCPICGSDNITVSSQERQALVEYGPSIPYQEELHHCAVCGETGDFTQHNDDVIEQAYNESKKQSIGPMITYLASKDVSMAYFERTLDLPSRTLARWKSEGCSASGIALLRLIRTCPWLLEIAQHHYDTKFVSQILLKEAANVLSAELDARQLECNLQLEKTSTETVNISGTIATIAPAPFAHSPGTLTFRNADEARSQFGRASQILLSTERG